MPSRLSASASLLIEGDEFSNDLTGTAAKEKIYGFAGNDVIDGKGGNDYISAGDGNDKVFGHIGDKMSGGAGLDDLRLDFSTQNYDLNLTLTGRLYEYTEIAPGTFMRSFETIFFKMGKGTNLFDARGAKTRMIDLDGTAGIDTFKGDFKSGYIYLDKVEHIELDFSKSGKRLDVIGGHPASSMHEIGENFVSLKNYQTLKLNLADGDDEVSGTGAADIIKGNGGNDIIRGLGGKDFLYGGAGNDKLYGEAGATLDGGAGNDIIYGTLGATMIGGSGNDIAVLDFSKIKTSFDFSVQETKENIVFIDETTTLKGFESLSIKFGKGDNVVKLGNLQLKLSKGFSAEIDGGKGNDTLQIDASTRGGFIFRNFEKSVIDMSKNTSGVSLEKDFNTSAYVLNTKTLNAKFFSPDVMDITGSRFADTLVGGSHADTIKGGAGDDVLRGGRGSDALYGGDGNDVLIGGYHSDYLVGGKGSDLFTFEKASDSQMPAEYYLDVIADFEQGKDKIDLSPIDTSSRKPGDQAFTFKGTREFSGKSGEVRYYVADNGVFVEADTNGDRIDDMCIFIAGLKTLTASDFIL